MPSETRTTTMESLVEQAGGAGAPEATVTLAMHNTDNTTASARSSMAQAEAAFSAAVATTQASVPSPRSGSSDVMSVGSANAETPQLDDTNLIVNYLPYDMTEKELKVSARCLFVSVCVETVCMVGRSQKSCGRDILGALSMSCAPAFDRFRPCLRG